MIHPARTIPISELVAELKAANDSGLVRVQRSGPLSIYNYSDAAVYGRAWTPITKLARGLIIANDNEVIATPFPKFFNLGELGEAVPDEPFEVFEKLDGSLIIIFHDGNRWRTATRGSFDSEQARAAAAWLFGRDLSLFVRGETYLAEYVGPDNRIVVNYAESSLVFLGGYSPSGLELPDNIIRHIAQSLGTRMAERYKRDSLELVVAQAAELPKDVEGYVVRFASGHRVKIKGDEYCRIHRLVSNVTPLGVWDMLRNGDDIEKVRRQLPEEFLADFDSIVRLLRESKRAIVEKVQNAFIASEYLGDKELGLHLAHYQPPHQSLLWEMRKLGHVNSNKARDYLFKAIRPTGNVLEGYRPLSAVNRLTEHADELNG
jgi:RNA ligase